LLGALLLAKFSLKRKRLFHTFAKLF